MVYRAGRELQCGESGDVQNASGRISQWPIQIYRKQKDKPLNQILYNSTTRNLLAIVNMKYFYLWGGKINVCVTKYGFMERQNR